MEHYNQPEVRNHLIINRVFYSYLYMAYCQILFWVCLQESWIAISFIFQLMIQLKLIDRVPWASQFKRSLDSVSEKRPSSPFCNCIAAICYCLAIIRKNLYFLGQRASRAWEIDTTLGLNSEHGRPLKYPEKNFVLHFHETPLSSAPLVAFWWAMGPSTG